MKLTKNPNVLALVTMAIGGFAAWIGYILFGFENLRSGLILACLAFFVFVPIRALFVLSDD